MSWISFPYAAVVPANVGSDPVVLIGTLNEERAGVPNRRKGTAYDWTAEQRAQLLAVAGAVESDTKPSDWRNPEPP